MRTTKNPFLLLTVTLGAALHLGAPLAAESVTARTDRAEEVETLLTELADPELRTWEATENKIIGLWSRSGSATADLLLERGQQALEEEDYGTAIEHLTALTDHAPDFAEGWNARATAFYLIEEFGLAMEDLERTLALNPHHFGALTGLGIVLEQMGRPEAALTVLRRAHAINPHRENIADSITRLELDLGEFRL